MLAIQKHVTIAKWPLFSERTVCSCRQKTFNVSGLNGGERSLCVDNNAGLMAIQAPVKLLFAWGLETVGTLTFHIQSQQHTHGIRTLVVHASLQMIQMRNPQQHNLLQLPPSRYTCFSKETKNRNNFNNKGTLIIIHIPVTSIYRTRTKHITGT